MANQAKGVPWMIDTASLTADLTTDQVVIKAVAWTGATTAGHLCEITDSNNCTKWSSVANAANYVERDYPHIPSKGIRVRTLGSGRVFLELG